MIPGLHDTLASQFYRTMPEFFQRVVVLFCIPIRNVSGSVALHCCQYLVSSLLFICFDRHVMILWLIYFHIEIMISECILMYHIFAKNISSLVKCFSMSFVHFLTEYFVVVFSLEHQALGISLTEITPCQRPASILSWPGVFFSSIRVFIAI